MIESIVIVTVPPPTRAGVNAATPGVNPSVGGIGPPNSVVVASNDGNGADGLSVAPARSSRIGAVSDPPASCPAATRGTIGLVIRGDSREVGPDTTEFTSNAVTA